MKYHKKSNFHKLNRKNVREFLPNAKKNFDIEDSVLLNDEFEEFKKRQSRKKIKHKR